MTENSELEEATNLILRTSIQKNDQDNTENQDCNKNDRIHEFKAWYSAQYNQRLAEERDYRLLEDV